MPSNRAPFEACVSIFSKSYFVLFGNFSLNENQTPLPGHFMILFHQSIENLLKRRHQVLGTFTEEFFFMNFYSSKACMGPGTEKFCEKNQLFGHMIHQIHVKFSKDHEYAVQKNSTINSSRHRVDKP